MNITDNVTEDAPLDVLIVGAGLSGIGAGCYLASELPGKTWTIVEARGALGGTWDLFRYPGVRSDSDLYTFGFDFKPWTSDRAIAGAPEILAYLREAAAEHGVDARIRYHHRVVATDWDSTAALWTSTIRREDTGEEVRVRSRWLFCATGYYNYAQGHNPSFKGAADFRGRIVHPQFWPEDLDHAGKRIAVVGSGATAVTLVPAMAETAAHVTMIQRTPGYILSIPSRDGLANRLRRWLPERPAYAIARRKNIAQQRWIWLLCQRRPKLARRLIRWANTRSLPDGFPVDEHFNPPYDPWDQRLCAVPDGDFFRALRKGTSSIVTGAVDRFTETGVRMVSGAEIAADIIVTATGLELQLYGGAALSVDGARVEPTERLVFKGMMLDGVPNFCFAVGYTNASWTLKVGLLCRYFCRLLRHMDECGDAVCVPVRPDREVETRPLLDFGAGYVRRALHRLPRQGDRTPWEMTNNYAADARALGRGPVVDPAMRFSPAPTRAQTRETEAA